VAVLTTVYIINIYQGSFDDSRQNLFIYYLYIIIIIIYIYFIYISYIHHGVKTAFIYTFHIHLGAKTAFVYMYIFFIYIVVKTANRLKMSSKLPLYTYINFI